MTIVRDDCGILHCNKLKTTTHRNPALITMQMGFASNKLLLGERIMYVYNYMQSSVSMKVTPALQRQQQHLHL